MRVFVWRSFSSNNSSDYSLVARFASPQLAEEVARELRVFFEAHGTSEDRWDLSEAMVDLAVKYDFEWEENPRLFWTEDWEDETQLRVAVHDDQVLVWHIYCHGLDGLFPYLEARGAIERQGSFGDPPIGVIFRLADGHAAVEATEALRRTLEERSRWSESYWWDEGQLGGFYGDVDPRRFDDLKALLDGPSFATYRLMLGDSEIKAKIRTMADCPLCPQCRHRLALIEAGPRAPEDQALCHGCGAMYVLTDLARMSSIKRLEACFLYEIVAVEDGGAVAVGDRGAVVWRWDGQCWQTTRPSGRDWHVSPKLVRRRNGELLLVTGGVLEVSRDQGQSWTELTVHLLFDITEAPTSGELFGIAREGVERSVDGGASWTRVSDMRFTSIAAAASGSMLWATTDKGQLFRSDDGGVSWQSWIQEGVRGVVPLTDRVFAIGDALLGGDGQRWREAEGTGEATVLDVVGDGRSEDRLYAVNNRGQLLLSKDRGLSWRATESGVSSMLGSLCITDQGELIAVGSHGAAVHISAEELEAMWKDEE